MMYFRGIMVLEPSEMHLPLIKAVALVAYTMGPKTADLLLKQPANDLLAPMQVSAFYPGLFESSRP
jgi:hypothetical protein